jgi:tripartite-type tricarboxylate transporter receptor subunit TctC
MPVRLVVGAPPGGGTDIIARLMGQWLSERLGQQFVIDNRPGAGTNIATEAVVRAPPDGYTLLLIAPTPAINATLSPGSRPTLRSRRRVFTRRATPRPG